MKRRAFALACLVAHATVATAFAQTEPPAPPPAQTPEAPAPPPPGTTVVRLDEPGAVLLATQAWANWHTRWTSNRVVCSAPCTAIVPLSLTYRIVGDEIAPSSTFTLPARPLVHLDVVAGSPGAHEAGGLLLILGCVGGIGGAMWLAGGGTKGSDLGPLVMLGVSAAVAGLGFGTLLSTGTAVRFN